MKKYLIIILVVFAVGTVKAQSGYGFKPWGLGLGVGYATAYANVGHPQANPTFDVSAIYSLIPYFPIALEFQAGQFSGGGLTPALDIYSRKFTNNYKALLIHEDLHMGAYLDYSSDPFLRVIKNFYGGTGVGVIFNSVKNQRTGYINDQPVTYPGSDKSTNVMIPIRVGYEFKIYDFNNAPNLSIDIGFTDNIVFNSGIDGYNDPNKVFVNSKTIQQYNQVTVGVKMFFGETKLYNKLIRSYSRY